MTTYKRNCPICNDEIEYTNKRSWYNAKKRNSKCKPCQDKNIKEIIQKKLINGESWGGIRNKEREKTLDKPYKRNCPECNSEMSYSRKDILENSIKYNTVCNSCSAYKYNKTFNDIITEDHRKQMRATKAGFSSWEEYKEKYPKKEMYKREVWRYTYQNDLEKLPNWEKRGRNGVDGAYQLDHIVSINEGWEKKIPPQEIAKWENLRMITWEENRQKW